MRSSAFTFIERHCEKLALCVSALAAIYLACTFLIRSPNTVTYEGRTLAPRELHATILRQAHALQQQMDESRAPQADVPPYHERFERRHAAGVFGAGFRPPGEPATLDLRQAATFGRAFELPTQTYRDLPTLSPPAPAGLVTATGHALRNGIDQSAVDADSVPSPWEELTWIRIAALFDTEGERQARQTAGYPPHAQRVHIVGIDVQRQQLLANGEFSPWQPVHTPAGSPTVTIPAPTFDDRTGRLLNREDLRAASSEIESSRESLLRPSLPCSTAVVQMWPESVFTVDASDATRIWTYDTHVHPGKTYRYRMRARVWNPLLGRPQTLADPTAARNAVIAGAWSRPSETAQAAPRTHFFLLGRGVQRDTASVEVWRWLRGHWLRKTFTAAVGDVIGGMAKVKTGDTATANRPIREPVDFSTGVALLDLREETPPALSSLSHVQLPMVAAKPTLVLTGYNAISDLTFERSQQADRNNPLRRRLRARSP